MEYHLEKQIRLSEKPKFDSLYPWCLEEIDGTGEKTGRDWIPWSWRLPFTVSELRLDHGLRLDHERDKTQDFKESKIIAGNLHPGICNDGEYLENKPWFSMLGTNREITNFYIRMHAISGDESEYCKIYGFISYTSEIDFYEQTEPDCIQINVGLSEDKFNRLADLISNKMIDVARINVRKVSGFYSRWSPDVRTGSVKVLTPHKKDQMVIMPEDCKIDPPRLGKVEEFELNLITRCKLFPKQNFETLNISKLFEEEEVFSEEEIQIDEHEDINKQLLTTIVQNQLEILKLRTPLWIIAVLLGAFVLLELI